MKLPILPSAEKLELVLSPFISHQPALHHQALILHQLLTFLLAFSTLLLKTPFLKFLSLFRPISAIRPMLEYYSVVWHHGLTKAQVEQHETVRRRAI